MTSKCRVCPLGTVTWRPRTPDRFDLDLAREVPKARARDIGSDVEDTVLRGPGRDGEGHALLRPDAEDRRIRLERDARGDDGERDAPSASSTVTTSSVGTPGSRS